MDKELIQHLLSSPDSQLDSLMKPLIEKWSDPPTALQILEVVDHCIHGSLASGLIVTLLQLALDDACKLEGVTHEDLVKKATWRKES